MSFLIGIAGPLGVGKSTVAALLAEALSSQVELGRRVRMVAFADGVKAATQQVFALEDFWLTDEYKNTVHPQWGLTPREMYDGLGEGLKTPFGVELWVKRMTLVVSQNPFDGYIFGDVRNIRGLDLEAQWIREHHGVMVHVEGPARRESEDNPLRRSIDGQRVERQPEDLILINNGSLMALRSQVNLLAEAILGRQQ